MMRALFTLFFILLFSVVAVGQLTISGPQQVCQGNTYVYSVSGASGGTGGIGMGSYTWSLNNSNIGSGLSVNVTIPSTATADELKVIYVEGRSLSSFQTETIYLNKPYPGIVNLNSNSTICYGQSASISVGLQRLGPNGSGNFQKRTGSVWQDISAPGTSITVPNLTTDTDFRFKISNSCGTQYSNVVSVSVKPALNPGGITNAQTICYNGNPSTLGSSSSASNGIGGYSYQWQKRPAGSNWQNISGANSTSYNPPTLTTTHDYRRRVISCGQTKYTNTIRVTVKSPLSPGGINNAQTVCYGGNPSTLGNSSSASNGLGGYTYQWQIKSPSGSWSNISGATSTTYNPPTLTATRDYRRRVISCGQTKYTNTIRVTVLPQLSPGSINNSHTVCYGGNPSTLGNSSSALNGLGGYSYQWQISTDGGSNFSNISGATSTTYNPPSLTATRDYRRRVISCGQTKYSNTIRVTVKSPLNSGSINGAQTVCYGGNPSTLGNSTSPSNGLGGYNYQWQIKSPSGSWSNISGATSSTYNPPSLTATRDYRRMVVSCGQTQYSNTVRITVKSALAPGSITNAQTICYGENPDALGSSSSASNGLGGYSYQWQSKSPSGTWSNISGETATTYNPSSLNETTDFRRRVYSCGQTKYSNVIRVTVRPDLSAGSINGDKSICYSTSAGTLGNSSSASGGNGSYTYQWQRRSPGGNWANISGETSTSLSPGNLNDDTEFRRRVYSCGQYKYSNVVTVNVFNQVSTPTTSSYGRCGPGVINLNPSVGSGGNTIRWYNNSSGGSHFTQTLEYAPDLSADQTYYISSYSTLTGCESSRVAINAVINPEPNVDAGSTLNYYEFENSVNLSGTGESPQGGNYSGSYVNNDNFDLSQSGTGSYTVFYNYTNAEGCPGTDSKTIIVDDNPEIVVNGNNEIVWGESRTLSVPAGFASYQWYRNDQAISGATSNIYEAGSVGEYKVNITADNNNSMMVSPKNIINNASLQNENFVQTINYKVKASEGQGMREIGEVNEQIVYFDGLGRKFQTVMTQASPNKMDLVAPIEYDELGRPSKEFLPYVPGKNDGMIDHSALRGTGEEYVQSNQYDFYAGGSSDKVANTSVPYAETVYENSPLNRPVAHYAPGEEWAKEEGGNAVTTAYEINSPNDHIIHFEIDGDTLAINGEYGNGLFQKTIVTDENGNQSVTFTDAFDKTILKRNIANGENFDTYYVYDLYDNLRFVIPPEAIHQLSLKEGQYLGDLLDQFVFQYRYDNKDRMEWKKVPGAKPVIMIYDDRDRLVLTQDGEQAKDTLFSFTKYDALNRPIMTGEKEINYSISNLRDSLNGDDWLQNYDAYETMGGSKLGYTSNSMPKNLELDEIHTVTYYDNYDFRSEISLDGVEYDYSVSGTENAFEQTDFVKGQVTGSLTRILGTNEMLASVNYYDERNRLIQNIREKNGDNLISSSNVYDFVGNLLNTDMTYQLHDKEIKISESFTYDHADRLLEQYHSLSETVNWQNVTGYSIDENFDLTHNGSAGYHNTSAHTAKAIGSDQVGFIEHRPEMFSRMLFGLNDDATGTGYTDMEYCLYVAANGSLVVYENGSNKGGLGSYQIGDVLQVAKTKDEIHYIKNGEVLRSRPLEHHDVAFYGDVTSYNVGDRITDVFFSTSGKQLMLSNQYNELGELINKKLHQDEDNFAQSVDYRYNIRGWLTRINHADLSADNAGEKADLFGMELGYTDNLGTSAGPQHNGNIAAVKWGGKRNDLEAENVLQQNSYGYGYDGLNRITEANFYESASQNPGQKYQLRINEYDRNGNIKQLQRKDAEGVLIDSLVYDYTNKGNQLNFVTDLTDSIQGFKDGENSGNDFAYDDNGNMVLDSNKLITKIKYNLLNLPEEVIFENGDKIVYIYDASGVKLRQEVYKNETLQKATDYIGSLIIENDTLQFIQTAEGRVVPKTVDGVDKNEYQYHLKDHLGNVRSTFAVRDVDYAADFEKVLVDGVLKHDNPYFNNYDSIDILSNPLKRSGNYAHRLTGGGTDIVGLMKSLYVSKGDRVSAEVYGKYLDAQFTNDEINGGALINALVMMFGGGTLSGEGSVVQNNLNSDYISAAMADGSEEESPKAYLNYIMLDKNFNYVNSGFERLLESAADPGDGSGTHQKLSFEEIQIEEDGYLMVFLSNESQQSVEVFWDDFKVDHHYNAVLQADDYYPFGLTFNSYQRSYSKANNYKYNGFEEQVEWGVYDYQARYYDPSLGRFLNVDPAADLMRRHSPYNYAFDNPIRFIDPDGMMPSDVVETDPCKNGCMDEVVVNGEKPGWMKAFEAVKETATNVLTKLDNAWNSLKQDADPEDTEVIIHGDGGDEGAYNERSANNTVSVELDDVTTLGGALIKQAYKDIKLPKVNNNNRTVSNPSNADRAERVGEAIDKTADANNSFNNSGGNNLPIAKKSQAVRILNDSTIITQTYKGKNSRGAPIYVRDTSVVGQSQVRKLINN